MNYVNLSSLPTKKHAGKECIDWLSIKTHSVDFKYNKFMGTLSISNYNKISKTIDITYNNKTFSIQPVCLVLCKLGVLDCIYFNHPMKKYIKNIEDSLRHKPQSNVKVTFKCDVCGFEEDKNINTVYKHGYRCKICKDCISYPEKFMISVLKQLNIDFLQQYHIKTNNSNYYIDFFIPSLNIFIEMDGGFHFKSNSFSDADVVIERDNIKNTWSEKHGYQMIRINSILSERKYLECEIRRMLGEILNIDAVDFNLCTEYAFSNTIKAVCEFRDENPLLYAKDIGNYFGISAGTVRRFLKMGNDIGIVNYNSTDESTRRYNKIKKSIHVCSLDGIVIKSYNSITDCVSSSIDDFNEKFTSSGISSCLSGRLKSHKNHIFTYQKTL